MRTSTAIFDGMRSAGRPAELHAYPGTGHWFIESDRPEYAAEAAELAWSRMMEFSEHFAAR